MLFEYKDVMPFLVHALAEPIDEGEAVKRFEIMQAIPFTNFYIGVFSFDFNLRAAFAPKEIIAVEQSVISQTIMGGDFPMGGLLEPFH